MRVKFDEMQKMIKKAFIKAGLSGEKAETCARIHTESSRDGVYSHGSNRVANFVRHLNDKLIDPDAEPVLEGRTGLIENYDGRMGPGVLNALFCMERAMKIASEQGMGLVALKNTTHWMRGGSYGHLAASKGYIGICWTNTETCMPAWGALQGGVGNNPLIMAVPNGVAPVVLDMAMSQYSYGKLEVTRQAGDKLPFPGGFDKEGNLTDDPGPIEESRRLLPMGYWKGSGFAVLLDLVAALLSGGLTTAGIDRKKAGNCGGCSQIYMAFDPEKLGNSSMMVQAVSETIEQLHNSIPDREGGRVYYPGERTALTRKENMEKGIPVNDEVWKTICTLAGN